MAVGVQKPPQSFRELWRRAFERKPNPYAPTETEIVYLEAVSNMRLESEILDYDEHIARELRDMVSKWRDGAGELLLGLLKRELDMVAKEVKGRKRPVGDLDKAQLRVLKKLGDAVASSIEYHPGSAFSLDRALVERKASSLGMSQLMLIVGKSLGLDLSAIEVRVLQTGESLQMDNGHVACICYLASGRIVMLDIAKGLMSKPFRVIDEFDIDGEYLIQKDGSEASDIHRKIRIITREGVKALVHLEIAAAHERAGRYKDAIAEDTKAIIHDPEMFYAYYRRAVNHMLSGDAEEAVLDYNRALSVYPGSVETHVNRGKALYALERLGPARAAYDEAIRLKPDFEECLICRGDLLSEMGDHKGAMADFEAVLRLNPRSSQGYRGRADLYNRIGKYEESLAEFDMALEIDPDNLMALCGRGTAYGLLGRAEESRRDFKAAMAAGPKLRRIITNMAGNVGIDLGATVSGSARPGPKADETSIESSPDSGGGKQVATETPLAASAPDSAFDLQAALNDVQNIRKNLASMWDPDLEPIASDAERMLTGQTPLTPDAYRGIKTRYDSYLEGSAWQKANSARYNLKPDERVTYFCLEYGLTEQMNTYGGGLGILAGDHLRGASDRYSQGTFVAVGMAWKKGYFKQEISGGRQREGYKVIPFEKYAERVRVTGDDGKERDLVIKIESKDQEETRDGKRMSVEKYIYAKAWRVRVGRVELYLLDTDIDENKNPAMSPLSPNPHDITTNLYLADDREWRFKQEYLLGLGGVRLLQALGIRLAALHLNEGHAAFAAVELVKCELEKRAKALDLSPTEAADIRKKDPEKARRLGIDFSQAVAAVKPRVGFTSHTPISAGNEMFEPWIVEPYFKKYCELHGIEYNAFIGLCVERGWMTANLSRLAISLSADVTPEEAAKAILERVVVTRNGVSIKGGEVSKLLYGEGSFGAITNSVHRRFWQAKPMRDLLESRWQDLQAARSVPAKRLEELSMAERQKHLKTLLANITDDELMQVRKRMKEEAIEHLAKVRGVKLDKDAFTIVISRRFALYKRLGMILNVDDWKTVMAEDFQGQILDRLIQSARENGLPLQIVFAGKAHPQDREPQDVMAKVLKAMEVSRWRDVIKFVPDYDIEVAKDLIQIATVWENNPIPPQEACGTSGEKVAANGGLNVSSPDGWELEADPQSTVFLFGEEGSYEDIERVRDRNVRRELDARDLRELEELYTGPWRDQGTDHEKGIINMYRHHPERWAQRMRGAIYDYMVNFDMPRFMEDYESKMYIPLVQGGRYADLHPDRMATTTPSGKVAAEAWETIAKNPLLMVAISAVRELGRRTNVRHQEFFGIVEKFVPPSMVNLLQAMSQLRPITERTGVTDGELAVAIKSVKDRLSLSFDEESILWLAMTGPGQDIVRGNGSGGEGRAAAAKGDGGKAGSVSGEKAAPPAKKDETSAESKSRIAGTGMAGGREAGQLFTLVENTLNSERSKAVSAAKALGSLLEARFNAGTAEPAFTLGVDASAADAKSAIEGLISEAERLLGGSMPDDIGGVVSLLKNSVGRIEADSLVASMIAMARRANIEGRHLVIGVETGWMSGYGGEKASQQKAMRPLIQEIEQLGAKLRSLGLDNVTVIHKEGDELADALLSTSRSTDTPLSNVVVLAAKSTVDSNAFAALRSEPGREGAFIAAVDPAELVRYAREHGDSTELLNIKVVEMLCIALELASGKEPPHTPLIINYDKGRRIVVFLPKAEPVDFGKAKSIYDAQKTALAAA
jgi:starch phosphorylase